MGARLALVSRVLTHASVLWWGLDCEASINASDLLIQFNFPSHPCVPIPASSSSRLNCSLCPHPVSLFSHSNWSNCPRPHVRIVWRTLDQPRPCVQIIRIVPHPHIPSLPLNCSFRIRTAILAFDSFKSSPSLHLRPCIRFALHPCIPVHVPLSSSLHPCPHSRARVWTEHHVPTSRQLDFLTLPSLRHFSFKFLCCFWFNSPF